MIGDLRDDQRIPLIGGFLGVIVDSAGDGVAAAHRPLGPTQHLNAFEVEQVRVQTVFGNREYAIDIGCDRLVARDVDAGIGPAAGGSHAAHGGAVAVPPVGIAELQSRHELLQVHEVLDPQFLDLGVVQGRHAHRHLEDVLLAPFGGDDDLLGDARDGFLGGLSGRGYGDECGCECRGNAIK